MGTSLTSEPRTPDGFDGLGGPADFDLCGALTTEETESRGRPEVQRREPWVPLDRPYGIGRPGDEVQPGTA